ncbi:MAG: nascent polypeptide-associated complex protein [Candidatus Micrarchaeia archaeon]
MIPNMDIESMRKIMSRMGIKTNEINANRVLIECDDKTIIIENPQVVQIVGQGLSSFQISGDIKETEKSVEVEVTQEDIKVVMDQTGATEEEVKDALKNTKGDIAEAILKLKENKK